MSPLILALLYIILMGLFIMGILLLWILLTPFTACRRVHEPARPHSTPPGES